MMVDEKVLSQFKTIYLNKPVILYDCNNCVYINITEKQQQQKNDKFHNHYCTYYNSRVFHKTQDIDHDSRLYPCKECDQDNNIHYTI